LFLVKKKDIKQHKGELLNIVVRSHGIKITALTNKVGVDRSTFYNHIKDPILPYEDIAKYGAVLKYDFSSAYSKSTLVKQEDQKKITTFEEMERNRDFWKAKYLALKQKIVGLAGEEE
jgi:hypothetical protein